MLYTDVYVVHRCLYCTQMSMLYTDVYIVHRCLYCTQMSMRIELIIRYKNRLPDSAERLKTGETVGRLSDGHRNLRGHDIDRVTGPGNTALRGEQCRSHWYKFTSGFMCHDRDKIRLTVYQVLSCM